MTEQLQLISIEGKRVHRGADISKCGAYRYTLWRCWNDDLPTAVFVLLNPSRADARKDDLTIRKCVGFARRWGCGSILVVNLFAYRTPYPKELAAARAAGTDITGPDNREVLLNAILASKKRNWTLIAAWGSQTEKGLARDLRYERQALLALCEHNGAELQCLGRTKDGSPRHPSRLSYDTELQPWGDP